MADEASGAAFAIAYYQTARAEIAQRIVQRDVAIGVFLVAATAIFGVALDDDSRTQLLFAVPLFGLACATAYSQHNVAMGALGAFLGTEFEEWVWVHLGHKTEGSNTTEQVGHRPPPHWDASRYLLETTAITRYRWMAERLILVGVSLGSVLWAIAQLTFAASTVVGATVGFASCLATFVVLQRTTELRAKFNDEMKQVRRELDDQAKATGSTENSG